jgi:hypothetical protein
LNLTRIEPRYRFIGITKQSRRIVERKKKIPDSKVH